MDRDRYEVELDGDLLDVLASETRRGILESLGDRRRTLSELARDLDRNKSTIHEHLGRLTDAGLVARDENDERKWTYYELTDEGQRILQPDRTRVRLVIGAAVAGLLAGVLVAAGLGGMMGAFPPLADEPSGGADAPADGSTSADALAVDVARTEALSSEGTTLEATVAGEPPDGPWHAYLIPEEEADDGHDVDGIAANVTVEGSNLTVTLPGDVRPGDYRLYVVAGDRRVELEEAPEIRLRDRLVNLTAATFWQGVSGDVTVERTAGIVPADAPVVARPVDGGAHAASVTLEDGEATVPASVLDDLPEGEYRLAALPRDDAPLPLGARLEVQDPEVLVTPQVVREDRPVDVRVHVRPSAAADEGVPVRVDGEEQDTAVVDRDTRTFRITPSEPGDLTVTVGRQAEGTITVLPEIDATLDIVDGPAWEITVRNETGDPAPGVDVYVDGVYRASTNASGQARLDVPEDGPHGLRLAPGDGPAVDIPVEADGWNATVLEPRAGLVAAAASPSPGQVNVSVEARNDRPAPLDGTVLARVDDEVAGADRVSVAAESSTNETLEVANETGGDLDVTVTAAAPRSPDLSVRNRTDGGGGGGDAEGSFEAEGSMVETDSVVTVGTTRTNVTVAPALTAEDLRDTADAALSPVPVGPDEDASMGAPEGAEAVPGPAVVLRVVVLSAAALAWGARRRDR